MKLKALYNAAIVKPEELTENQKGRIIVPDLGNEVNKIGRIVDVGEGYYSATGVFIETKAQVGDLAVLPTMGFTRFEFQGEEFYIGPENQILATIKD